MSNKAIEQLTDTDAVAICNWIFPKVDVEAEGLSKVKGYVRAYLADKKRTPAEQMAFINKEKASWPKRIW